MLLPLESIARLELLLRESLAPQLRSSDSPPVCSSGLDAREQGRADRRTAAVHPRGVWTAALPQDEKSKP